MIHPRDIDRHLAEKWYASPDPRVSLSANSYVVPSIDEYLRERLMPVEGVITHVQGIETHGNSIPAGTVGGDLFEYMNFQQRYDIDARIQRALKLSNEDLDLEPLPASTALRNSVDGPWSG